MELKKYNKCKEKFNRDCQNQSWSTCRKKSANSKTVHLKLSLGGKNKKQKGVRYIQVRNICIMGVLEERKSQETF